MQAARSLLEAEVFLELQPCECGERATEWDFTSFAGLPAGPMRVNFEGTCRECGLVRRTHIAIPDRPPERGHFSRPEDGPSRLLDPGDWWAIGKRYADSADVKLSPTQAERLPAGDHFDVWMELAGLLSHSAAAIDEILRFLPDGAAEVPVDAFRSAPSRELREREPGSFMRSQLIADQAARRRRATEFFAQHPEPARPDDEDEDDDD